MHVGEFHSHSAAVLSCLLRLDACYSWTGHSYVQALQHQHRCTAQVLLIIIQKSAERKCLFKACHYIITVHQATGLCMVVWWSGILSRQREVLYKLKGWQTESESKGPKVREVTWQTGCRRWLQWTYCTEILPYCLLSVT